jgi:hypothetical protein
MGCNGFLFLFLFLSCRRRLTALLKEIRDSLIYRAKKTNDLYWRLQEKLLVSSN